MYEPYSRGLRGRSGCAPAGRHPRTPPRTGRSGDRGTRGRAATSRGSSPRAARWPPPTRPPRPPRRDRRARARWRRRRGGRGSRRTARPASGCAPAPRPTRGVGSSRPVEPIPAPNGAPVKPVTASASGKITSADDAVGVELLVAALAVPRAGSAPRRSPPPTDRRTRCWYASRSRLFARLEHLVERRPLVGIDVRTVLLGREPRVAVGGDDRGTAPWSRILSRAAGSGRGLWAWRRSPRAVEGLHREAEAPASRAAARRAGTFSSPTVGPTRSAMGRKAVDVEARTPRPR